MRLRDLLLVTLLQSACGGTDVGENLGPPFCDSGTAPAGLTVPTGFCIRKFAAVPTARVLAFAPNGDVFVTSPSAQTAGGAPAGSSAIYVLTDDGTGAATVSTYKQDYIELGTVHGLAFLPNRLLYTVEDRVNSLPYASGDRSAVGKTPTKYADLSDTGIYERWTHTLAVAADGTVYVSRGQFDNDSCPPPQPRSGTILRIGVGQPLIGSVVVGGLRNAMYLRCVSWGCFGAELTGDNWDGIGGKEKLIQLHDGDEYGYPCCVDKNVPRPDINPKPDCSRVAVSIQTYALHDTPFGFDWDVQNAWPAPYRGAFFVGMHGSFETWVGTRLGWATVDATSHRPTGELKDFVTGFSKQGPVVGRVADVRFAPDGRLFFTDDQGGAVYWVAPVDLRRKS